jgi:hypothetical protein
MARSATRVRTLALFSKEVQLPSLDIAFLIEDSSVLHVSKSSQIMFPLLQLQDS